jgi:16S rRNA (guanine527-N7)-methyltransferase
VGFLQDWKKQGHISESTARQLTLFAAAIHDWNPRINLTGFKTVEQIEEVLIGECLRALPHLQSAGRSILDFGSGAGVPGLVWAIAQPSCTVTSVEIRQKKVAFQKEMVRAMQLKNAEILSGLFPEAVADRRFDVIVTRAIRFSPKLWADARRLLTPDGRLVQFSTPGKDPGAGWMSVPVSPLTTLWIGK